MYETAVAVLIMYILMLSIRLRLIVKQELLNEIFVVKYYSQETSDF